MCISNTKNRSFPLVITCRKADLAHSTYKRARTGSQRTVLSRLHHTSSPLPTQPLFVLYNSSVPRTATTTTTSSSAVLQLPCNYRATTVLRVPCNHRAASTVCGIYCARGVPQMRSREMPPSGYMVTFTCEIGRSPSAASTAKVRSSWALSEARGRRGRHSMGAPDGRRPTPSLKGKRRSVRRSSSRSSSCCCCSCSCSKRRRRGKEGDGRYHTR